MNFFLTLALLQIFLKAQEDDGSILDILDGDSLTTDELTELESNIAETEELSLEEPLTSEEDSLDSAESTMSLEELTDLNSFLLAEQSDLESQLADANDKILSYLSSLDTSLPDLEEMVTVLDDYTHQLIRDALQAEAEAAAALEAIEDEEDEDDDEEEQMELSTSTIFVIALGFIFLILHGIRSILGFSIQSFLSPAFHSLFVDVTILLVICTVASLGYYTKVIDSDIIDYELMIIGTALFTFFWLLLGLWFIVAAQSFSMTWNKHERSCQDLRSLTQNLQEAQIDIAGGYVPRRLKAIYKDLQYAIMRQLFICPIFLPPVTETYLRTDFNLAEYLSRCIADTINKVFQLSWLGYSFIIVAVLVWRVIVATDHNTQFIALWALPGSVLVISLSFILKLKSAYAKLVPQPTEQIVLNLPRDNFGRSPDMNEDIIPKPEYLAGHFYSNDRAANYINCCFFKLHPLKLTWSYMVARCYPNRHELLFWGDRYGVDLVIGILQGISICLTLWITVILLYYIPILHDNWEWIGIFMIAACIVIWLFAAGYLLPEIIRLVTLTTKIEMKKDRKIIEDVIISERADKAKVIVRVYRQFKMIYRQKYGENPRVDDKVLEDFASEVFNMYRSPDTGNVDIEELEDIIALCGVKMEDDELRLFAKECKPEGNREISKQGFTDAVGTMMGSRKLHPEFVVKVVLTRYFQEGRGKNLKDASLEEIKQFFNDFYWHFSEEDIEEFLWETRFILEDIGAVEITELAGMVNNTVKNYPR